MEVGKEAARETWKRKRGVRGGGGGWRRRRRKRKLDTYLLERRPASQFSC